MTVAEMSDRMSNRELHDWTAFAAVEPFGCRVDDWRATVLTNAVIGSQGGKPQEMDKLFPWTREVYEAALSKEQDEALAARRMEAEMDRFFAGHNASESGSTAK